MKWYRIYASDADWVVSDGITDRRYCKVICNVTTATGEDGKLRFLSAKGVLREVSDKTGRKVAVIMVR